MDKCNSVIRFNNAQTKSSASKKNLFFFLHKGENDPHRDFIYVQVAYLQ